MRWRQRDVKGEEKERGEREILRGRKRREEREM